MSSPPPTPSPTSSSTNSEGPQRSQEVLQDVANNLVQSIFRGRKRQEVLSLALCLILTSNSATRTRPIFHPAVGQENETELTDPTTSPSPSSSYNGYGRIFQRQTNPFTAISTIVIAGIRHETADSDDETPADESTKRVIQCWNVLCGIIPNFREQMLELSSDIRTRKAVCTQISAGAAAARCDDTASLKTSIIDYVLADTMASRRLGLERKGKKVDRGFNHPVTAALLCPIKYEPTEETFNKLKTGLFPCGASLLPRFLFPENQAYNPEDIEDGCFRGHLLLRVAKHILQGPSAALQSPGFHRGRKGVAVLINMTSVTRPLLAYLGVQTHFALTSAANWDRIVGTFDYNEFYWNLLDFLEGPEGEEVIKLFDYHVFGSPVASEDSIDAGTQESDFDIIKLQRAAKRARLTAPTTPTTPPSSSMAAPQDVGSSTGSTTTRQEQPAGVACE